MCAKFRMLRLLWTQKTGKLFCVSTVQILRVLAPLAAVFTGRTCTANQAVQVVGFFFFATLLFSQFTCDQCEIKQLQQKRHIREDWNRQGRRSSLKKEWLCLAKSTADFCLLARQHTSPYVCILRPALLWQWWRLLLVSTVFTCFFRRSWQGVT